jgi:hypothetical protein
VRNSWYPLGQFSRRVSNDSTDSNSEEQEGPLKISDIIVGESIEKTTFKDGIWAMQVQPGTGKDRSVGTLE